MAEQTTLILLKPDAVSKSLSGEVLKRFEGEGFRIRGLKMLQLTDELLKEHYAHIVDRPFFPDVVAFMKSVPVVALALSGEEVIPRVRELLGPTDSRKAEKGTIRGDFGEDSMINVVHASDSPEAAAAELKRFFKDGEIFAY
jgi:nucleoside-diphosphate kinase